tara:strand:+ start:1175 stop:1720 length:546 start_codon:yes stop_codon:yes gene_type:complete
MKKIIFILVMLSFFTTNSKSSYKKLAYDFSFKDLDGSVIKLSDYKNNVLLVTNVASRCGFTSQYEDLQNVWERYGKKGLVVIGVPSNSFNQELGSNKEVKNFCEAKFGISFPMMQIVEVKGESAHPFYIWAKKNHGKAAIPKWNFHKIIIGKDGKVFDTFSAMTNPKSKKFISSIETALKK